MNRFQICIYSNKLSFCSYLYQLEVFMGVAGSALSTGGTDGKRENPDNLYFRAGAIQMAAVATFVAMHTHSPASALMHFGIGMLDADAIP